MRRWVKSERDGGVVGWWGSGVGVGVGGEVGVI